MLHPDALSSPDSGVTLNSDPFINTATTKNELVHNQMLNMLIGGILIREHRINQAPGFGPEQPIQQNNVSCNFIQGDVGLNLMDLAGTLRDFISNNNFTHNDFRQCRRPLQENVPGMANKNYFFMNLGL